jgi:DNA-binding XRE family transcriptional regulator
MAPGGADREAVSDMAEDTAPSIGDRIRELRTDETRGTMSQTQLAAAADVSVEVIRALEQPSRKYNPSIPTLHKIARALDVEIADLFRPSRPTLATVGPQSGAVALRRAVVSVDDLIGDDPDLEPLDLEEARRTVGYAWVALWQARTPDTLPTILPAALARMRATLQEVPSADQAATYDLAAQLYQLASSTLVHLGYPDAAHYAIREGMRLAGQGSDSLRSASLKRTVAWLCIQQGRNREAHHIATTAAAELAPTGNSPLPAWTLYGTLLLNGAIAAARDQDRPKAQVLLDEARDAATRTGHRNDYECEFGPEKVQMHDVDVAIVTENYTDALDEADRMPKRLRLPLLDRVNHLANIALAHTRLGHDGAALEVLTQIEQAAPQWLVVRRTAQMVIRELYDRATPPPLVNLARTAGLLR